MITGKSLDGFGTAELFPLPFNVRLSLIPRRPFHHLVGEREQRGRHVDRERLGGREIDDHFESCRLQDRQVGRFLALEDAARVDARELVYVVEVRPVTDQPADGIRDQRRLLRAERMPKPGATCPIGFTSSGGVYCFETGCRSR
jgi:hypothetical protein